MRIVIATSLMRIVIATSFTAFLIGCSGTYERMDAWMGTSKASVLLAFGRQPDATGQDALGDWVRWDRHEDGGCSDRFSFQSDTVVGYASDCGIWGGFSVPKAP